MNLLDLAVKITCDDQASSQVDGIASKIKSGLGTAAKAAAASVAAVGAGAVALAGSAVSAYADYEQLVGGVETLFGAGGKSLGEYAASVGQTVDQASAEYDRLMAAQQTMLDNANAGYQTAGVSANRYMEITTSFSAALINSLGGDTQAAAEYADKAIVQMSDNANKMGTDLGVIQESYQSIARGNYEMLDNLKLGYGGTKAELERLLDDAEQYMAANGEMRDLSVDNFADIVDAIQVVQDHMGITGTTALEASTTISGSINTMKAAWDNWVTGLGNEQADMSVLTDQLLTSIENVATNVAPRIGLIVGTIVTTIAEHGPEVASALGEMLKNAFVEGFNEASSLTGDVLQIPMPQLDMGQLEGFLDGISETMAGIGEAFEPVVEPMNEFVNSGILQSISNFFTGIGTAANEFLVPAIEALGPVFQMFFEALQPYIPIIQQVASFVGGVLVAAFTALVEAIGFVVSIVTIVLNALSSFGAFVMSLPETIGAGIQGIISWFASLPEQIWTFLTNVISSLGQWAADMGQKAIQAGSDFLSGINQKFNEVVNFFAGLPGRILGALGDLGGLLWNAGSSIIDGLLGGLNSAWEGVTGFFADITSQIPNLKGPIDVDAKLLYSNGEAIMSGLMGGLEKGWGEAASYLQSVTGEIPGTVDVRATASRSGNDSTLLDEVRGLRNDIKNLKIYLNGKTLVGGIVDDMDKALGKKVAWSATR